MIWCPYIPDDIDDSSATESSNSDNACRMLVLTNDEKVHILMSDTKTVVALNLHIGMKPVACVMLQLRDVSCK